MPPARRERLSTTQRPTASNTIAMVTASSKRRKWFWSNAKDFGNCRIICIMFMVSTKSLTTIWSSKFDFFCIVSIIAVAVVVASWLYSVGVVEVQRLSPNETLKAMFPRWRRRHSR